MYTYEVYFSNKNQTHTYKTSDILEAYSVYHTGLECGWSYGHIVDLRTGEVFVDSEERDD